MNNEQQMTTVSKEKLIKNDSMSIVLVRNGESFPIVVINNCAKNLNSSIQFCNLHFANNELLKSRCICVICEIVEE